MTRGDGGKFEKMVGEEEGQKFRKLWRGGGRRGRKSNPITIDQQH